MVPRDYSGSGLSAMAHALGTQAWRRTYFFLADAGLDLATASCLPFGMRVVGIQNRIGNRVHKVLHLVNRPVLFHEYGSGIVFEAHRDDPSVLVRR